MAYKTQFSLIDPCNPHPVFSPETSPYSLASYADGTTRPQMMAGPRLPRIVRVCEICRAAHARCDGQLPSCGRCALLKRECIRGLPFPFRHANNLEDDSDGDGAPDSKSDFQFAEDQIWVKPPGNVEFILEYPASEDSPVESVEPSVKRVTAQPSPQQSSTAPTPTSPESNTSGFGVRSAFVPAISSTWTPEQTIRSLEQARRLSSTSTTLGVGYSPSSSISHVSPRTIDANTTGNRHWPLAKESEALLLRHFVTKLSQWFDYCDPLNAFATSVIQRAITSPPLLYAILATSARHLSVTSGYDAEAADQYHRECVALLIPALDETDAALNDALFAATVILRLYEEISVPFAGRDAESHLLGTHTFVRAQQYHEQPSGIWQAAFRVVLRQEIVIAFRTQRPVQLLREYVHVDRALDAIDDGTVAFHVICLCAEVLDYCYGDEPKTPEAWDELATRARAWMKSKPVQFEPLLNRPADQRTDGGAFPEIWLLNDCHVAAHQHYLICQLLLVAHDPRRPQLGPRRAEAVQAMNHIIQGHVRTVCGIAVSNTHCIPAMFTASMVIGIGGDLFHDYKEQKAMMEILVKTDVDLAWPTASIQAYLRQQWGWDT